MELDVYAFLTTTPNPLVATINHERMPVLLTRPDEFDRWIHGTPEAAMAIAREHPAEQMHIVQSGYDKEDKLVGQILLGT